MKLPSHGSGLVDFGFCMLVQELSDTAALAWLNQLRHLAQLGVL